MRPISNVFASWTDSGTVYTGIGLNVVATAYNSLSRPFNIRFNGTSLFSVDTTGVIRNSTINAIFSTANASFDYANNLAVSSGNPIFAFGQANIAYDTANASYAAANNSSFTANLAYNNSNAAFLKANNALPNTSATFVGNMVITGNVVVSSNNTTAGGIVLSDDGDIVDLNDGYCSMRFSSGTRVYSGNKSGTPAITLGSDGNMTLTGSTLTLGTSSIGSSGYTRLPNGLLLQWGTSSTINQDGTGTVNFPTSFAATPYCIQITIRGPKNTGSSGTDSISTQNTTSFIIEHGADGNVTFYWMAIGI